MTPWTCSPDQRLAAINTLSEVLVMIPMDALFARKIANIINTFAMPCIDDVVDNCTFHDLEKLYNSIEFINYKSNIDWIVSLLPSRNITSVLV